MAEIKTEKRSLRYDFKARETHELSLELAGKNLEANRIENEAKAVASQYTSKVKVIKSEIAKISQQVNDGWELREIECDVTYHKPVKGKKTIVRKDNMQEWVEPMESWEWNIDPLFNQPGDDTESEGMSQFEEAVVVDEDRPKLLEN